MYGEDPHALVSKLIAYYLKEHYKRPNVHCAYVLSNEKKGDRISLQNERETLLPFSDPTRRQRATLTRKEGVH